MHIYCDRYLQLLGDDLGDAVAEKPDGRGAGELEADRDVERRHGRHGNVARVLVQRDLLVLGVAHDRGGAAAGHEAVLVEAPAEPGARERDALLLQDLVLRHAVREQARMVPAEGRDRGRGRGLLARKVVRRDRDEHVLLALEALDAVHPVREDVLVVARDEHVPAAPDLLDRRQEARVPVHVHHTLVELEAHEGLHARRAPRDHRGALVRVRREHDVVARDALAALEHDRLAALLDRLDRRVVAHRAVLLLGEELEERREVGRADVPPEVLGAVRAAPERAKDDLPERDVERVGVRLEAAQELRGREVEHVILGDRPEDRDEGKEVVAHELGRVRALRGPLARRHVGLHGHRHELHRERVDVHEDAPDAAVEEPGDAAERRARRELHVAGHVGRNREAHGDALARRAVRLGDAERPEPLLDVRVRVAEHHEPDVHELVVDLHVVRVPAERRVLLEQDHLVAVAREVVGGRRAADAGADDDDFHGVH
ncbi:hypothetical protein PybrP1_009269 [[Pythium] brassicae (nom. inval.)]|nr:hypothetical protein PybrP1_009269 [[Pythium] brassicae (nom. inval.)]